METKEKRRRPPQSGKAPSGGRSGTAVRQKRKRRIANTGVNDDIIYTQPGPFNRNRFILHLVSVVAVVFALLFGMSIFFKVKTVTVAGANKYTQWDICQASGIQEGENLFTLSEAKISSNIRSRLPYVDTVRVGIKLPDTVKIEIVELSVAYAVEAQDATWWLIRADGGVVEQINEADAEGYTKIEGVKLADPQVGQMATAWQAPSEETLPDGQTVPPVVDAVNQLQTVTTILQYLEENGVIGDADRVDVTSLNDLQLWWKDDRFQILLGDATQLSYKIRLVKTAIESYMETYDSGVLDVSLTIQPDPEKEYQVIYTPFE